MGTDIWRRSFCGWRAACRRLHSSQSSGGQNGRDHWVGQWGWARLLLVASIATGVVVVGDEVAFAQAAVRPTSKRCRPLRCPPRRPRHAWRPKERDARRASTAKGGVRTNRADAASDSAARSKSDKVPASVNVVDSQRNQAHRFAEYHDALRTARAGHQHQRGHRQSVSAGHSVPRLRGVSRGRHAAGPCGLPERRTHQRSLR